MTDQTHFLIDDYYLSVDGGGTSCKVALFNANGQMLGQGRAGASNARLGAERVLNEIISATQIAFADANLDIENMAKTHACFGLAGLELQRDQDNFSKLNTNFKSVILETDGVTACLGAFDGADGSIVITGTGTSAVAMNDGYINNIGGWGFEISDSGSGSIMGRNAVRYALRAAEGLEAQTGFTHYVMDFFNHDMGQMVLWAEQAEPKDFASFAIAVFDFAENGDDVANILITQHMKELTQLIEGSFNFGSKQFALLGGLAARSGLLLPSHLTPKYVDCKYDALFGGFLRIRKELSGSRVQVAQKFNLSHSHSLLKGKTHVKN